MRKNWTEEELILALALYLQKVPFSKISRNNPYIIKLASYIGRTPSAVGLKLCNLAHLDPVQRRRNVTGMQNGSKLDKVIWDQYVSENKFSKLLEDITNLSERYAIPQDFFLGDITPGTVIVNEKTPELTVCNIDSTEVLVTTKQRVGQSFFRNSVLTNFENKCSVTGIHSKELVEAAHIIPWQSSNDDLRLNPKNGIALNVLLHRAYDADLVGIDQDLIIYVSDELLCQQVENTGNFFKNIDNTKLATPINIRPDQDLLQIRFEQYKSHQ